MSKETVVIAGNFRLGDSVPGSVKAACKCGAEITLSPSSQQALSSGTASRAICYACARKLPRPDEVGILPEGRKGELSSVSDEVLERVNSGMRRRIWGDA